MIPNLFNVVFCEFLFTRIELSFKLISVSYYKFPLCIGGYIETVNVNPHCTVSEKGKCGQP